MSDTSRGQDWRRTYHTHVLVVAHQTATYPGLLEAVRKKREELGEATFHLLVPERPHDLEKDAGLRETEAQHVLDEALPKLSEAAGDEVTGTIGDADPWTAIRTAVHDGDYDEIIISTLPLGASRWLRLDLVSKTRDMLRKPVTHVQAPKKAKAK